MARCLVVERDGECTAVLSDKFPGGRGFVFPYGTLEDNNPLGLSLASLEPETHSEASERLDAFSAKTGLPIKKPTLQELVEIFSFITRLPRAIEDLKQKFLLLLEYPFFGFDRSLLESGRIRIANPSGENERYFSYSNGGPREVLPLGALSGEGLPNLRESLLMRLLGIQGTRSAFCLANYCSNKRLPKHISKKLESLDEGFAKSFIEFVQSNPIISNGGSVLEIGSVSSGLIVSPLSEDVSREFEKPIVGVPYMKFESTFGTNPERGITVVDRLRFNHNFFRATDHSETYGYALGIIK